MRGSIISRLVLGAWSALLGLIVLAGGAWAADASKPERKEKVPLVLEKSAPASIEELKAIQDHVKKIIKKTMPATVGIRIGMSAGSGVIISADGYVLTAGHVSGAPDKTCTLILPDGKEVKGKTLGRNTWIDSGLIKITEKGTWNHVEMGDSSKLKRGQWCLSIGHPGGFKPGRSPVVRLGRVQRVDKQLIESDCTLVGGDSGGPLFDMEGRVIGIHSRISLSIDQNIHVPIDTYRATWDSLVKGLSWNSPRNPAAGWAGVSFASGGDDLVVNDVKSDSPADTAGMKVGDVIVCIDGKKIAKRAELADYLDGKKINEEITLEILREKKPMTFKLKLGKRPAE